ncbi:TRAP transporter small permease subunit [Mesorhizobium sp. CAU 1732]|uniref:TRAP transporter small permease subunit n=1 Tax=Mesorhizobium sp. CAU 1732 TaxID=3140358 RepID=UPI0032617C3D
MSVPQTHGSTVTSSAHGIPLPLPETWISRTIDGSVRALGGLFSAVWVLLTLNIVVSVFLRYGMNSGSMFLEELQWHFFATGIALSIPYALSHDRHIRVDILSAKFRPRTTSWIEFYGILFLLLPYCVFVLWFSYAFVRNSFVMSEISLAPGGIPYRWIIKMFLPLSFLLLALAGIARLSRCVAHLRLSIRKSREENVF